MKADHDDDGGGIPKKNDKGRENKREARIENQDLQ